uniref:Uncharacterized protein n=1 Tax=Oryza meridionalis TaxID=40149 RepID=A0A0E0DZY3_9ORYZ
MVQALVGVVPGQRGHPHHLPSPSSSSYLDPRHPLAPRGNGGYVRACSRRPWPPSLASSRSPVARVGRGATPRIRLALTSLASSRPPAHADSLADDDLATTARLRWRAGEAGGGRRQPLQAPKEGGRRNRGIFVRNAILAKMS